MKIKHLAAPAVSLVMSVSVFGPTAIVSAQSLPIPVLSASSTSAAADNSSAITVTIRETGVFTQYDGVNWNCDPFGPNISGSGNTILVNGAPLSSSNNYPNTTYSGDANGNGTCTSTFTLKSSVAETKTIGLYTAGIGCPCNLSSPTMTLTFTAPVAIVPVPVGSSTTPSERKTTTTGASATTAKPADTPAPAAPQAASVEFNGAAIDSTKPQTITEGKPLVLAGKTVPNGIVTLTIHSTPKTVTVHADSQGNWTYTVDETGLEQGHHTIYATVTDPATNKTSDQSTLMSFTLAAAKKPVAVVAPAAQKKSSPMLLYAGAVVVIVASGIIGWLVWRRKKAITPTFTTPVGPSL